MEDAHCEVAVPTWRQRMREAALEAISPTRCAGCERPGALVCDDCIARITPIDPAHACTRCGAPFGDVLCTECAGDGALAVSDAPSGLHACEPACEPLGRTLAATVFEGPVPRIVRAYKDAGERRLAQPIAELMLDAAEYAEAAAPERY